MVRKFAYANGQIVPLWGTEELRLLKKLYPVTNTKELSKILERSPSAIKHKASRLDLYKNNAVIVDMKLTDVQRGWFAAAIDGEGSVILTRRRKRDKRKGPEYVSVNLLPEIRIHNTSLPFLEKPKNILGGTIYRCHRGGISKTGEKLPDAYTWVINTIAKTYPLLTEILSELVIKRKQAELLMEFCESRLNRPKQNDPYTMREFEIYHEIRLLNRLKTRRRKESPISPAIMY